MFVFRITHQWLVDQKICEKQISWFERSNPTPRDLENLRRSYSDDLKLFVEVFPNGCELTSENVDRAVNAGLSPRLVYVSLGFEVPTKAWDDSLPIVEKIEAMERFCGHALIAHLKEKS